MSGFSTAWLALREPADREARSVPLTSEMSRRLQQQCPDASSRDPVRILDLATGTGSNARYLAEHLPPFQEWTLLDSDVQLLTALKTRTAAWATRAGWATIQSRIGISVAAAGMEVRLHPQQRDISVFPLPTFSDKPVLVTASALLDLVSERWLEQLVYYCRDAEASVLFALTYDGRTMVSPGHADDELVLDLVNRHQQTDKGFGLALGPAATETAATLLDRAGYLVLRARSDWQLGPAHRRLQDELIAGWAAAACEVDPRAAARIGQWERDRRIVAGEGRLEIMVGHEDLAAWRR